MDFEGSCEKHGLSFFHTERSEVWWSEAERGVA